MERFTGLIGLTIVLAVALALSKNRRAIRWRTVGWAFALQMAFGVVVLYWERGKQALESFSNGVSHAIAFADQGSGFLFGWLAGPMDALGEKTGMPLRGFIFAFKVLPIIIFICAFFSILYHFGIIQVVVQGMAVGDAEDDEGLRRRGALRRGERLHRPDGGAGPDRALHRDDDDVRAPHDDDGRHGARLGRRHARLRRRWGRR